MKYLKKFETENDRSTYENSESYIEPYVSYVDGGDVHYNKVPETRLVITYNVIDASQPTQLHYHSGLGPIFNSTDIFDNIEVDGTDISVPDLNTAEGKYQLSVGEHIVKYTLKDPTYINYWLFGFSKCPAIISVIIPNSVTNIEYGAFAGCRGLTSITIGNSVTSIGNYAFQYCSGLTSVTIPSAVTSIGVSAFTDCTSLTNVTVEATTPPTLGSYTFDNNASGRKIYVPTESVDTYKAATNWSTYAADIQATPTP